MCNITDDDDKASEEFAKLREGIDYINIGGENIDAKERDPKYSSIIRKAKKEAERNVKFPKNELGYCNYLWEEQKRILKEQYDIDWRTPGELNPGAIYD